MKNIQFQHKKFIVMHLSSSPLGLSDPVKIDYIEFLIVQKWEVHKIKLG